MADIRIKDLGTTASVTASDDFMAVDGTTNGTRKLSAATPSFATSVTVPGVSAPSATNLTLAGGTAGTSSVVVSNTTAATTTTSGALRVGSNVGLSGNAGGASYFGGAVQSRAAAASFVAANYDYTGDYGLASTVGSLIGSNSTSASLRIAVLGSDTTSDPFVNFLTSGATNWVVGVDNSDSDAFVISRSNAPGTTNILRADSTTVSIPGTTSASSSTVGALTIGNGTAARWPFSK